MSRLIFQLLRPALLAGLATVLSACQPSDSTEALWDNYVYRLSNSLEVTEPEQPNFTALAAALPAYPKQRQSVPSINMNMLDFLRLSQCDLQRHIGQRNSSLGQVMEASQQWFYDIEFIRLASLCVAELERDSALYQQLEKAIIHKKRYLPEVTWNASFAAPEFVYLFSLGATPLSLEQLSSRPVELQEAIERLTLMVRHLKAQYDDGGQVLSLPSTLSTSPELYYRVIGSSKYVGSLRLSIQQAHHYLQLSDQLLEQRLKGKPLCFNQQASSQFRTVNNVFRKYYIGQVQPYLAQLHQHAEFILEALDDLYLLQRSTEQFPEYWQAVYKSERSEWQQFEHAIRSHTELWQSLLRQCGALPGAVS